MPALVPHDVRNVGEETVRVAGFFSSAIVVSVFDDPLMPAGKRVERALNRLVPAPHAIVPAEAIRRHHVTENPAHLDALAHSLEHRVEVATIPGGIRALDQLDTTTFARTFRM